MAKSVVLEIITPSKLFYKDNVEMVIVKTVTGEEGFMADHTWACKLLEIGHIWIKEEGSTEFKGATISGGYIDVRDSFVLYTDSAEWVEDIDLEKAKARKSEMEIWLSENEKKENISKRDIEKAKNSIKKQNARINLVEIGGKRKK